MPLKVDVEVNGELIERIHIGRLNADGGTGQGAVNDYGVIRGAKELLLADEPPFDRREFKADPEWVDWLEPDGQFQHRYGDGPMVLLMKALEKLTSELVTDVSIVVTTRLEAENAALRQRVTELQAAIDAPPF